MLPTSVPDHCENAIFLHHLRKVSLIATTATTTTKIIVTIIIIMRRKDKKWENVKRRRNEGTNQIGTDLKEERRRGIAKKLFVK